MPSLRHSGSDKGLFKGVGAWIIAGWGVLSFADVLYRLGSLRVGRGVDLARDVRPQVRRRAFDEGLLGGSGGWSVLNAVAYTFRFIQWIDNRDQPRSFVEDLKPGETIMIEHVEAEPTRRQLRKQARKQAKRDKKAARKTKGDHAQAHAAASSDDAGDELAEAVATVKSDIAALKKSSRRSRRKSRRTTKRHDKKADKAAAKQVAAEAKAAHKAQRRRARRKAARLQRKADKLERKAARTLTEPQA